MRKAVVTAFGMTAFGVAGLWGGAAMAADTITLMENGQALISFDQSISLKAGENVLRRAVPMNMRDGSVQISGPGLSVREQYIERSGDDLLSRFKDREVAVIWEPGGAETKAVLIKSGDGPVFRQGNRIVQGQPHRIFFDTLPDGFGSAVLTAKMTAEKAGSANVAIRGLADGLSWNAQYAATLKGDQVELIPWASLSNRSGMDYLAASLKIMAGEVNRAQAPMPEMKSRMADHGPMVMSAMAPMPVREEMGGFHLYTLPGSWDLPDGVTKQLPLMSPLSLKAEKQLIVPARGGHIWRVAVRGENKINPEMRLNFTNQSDQPLPAGIISLYGTALDGSSQFLGEDHLPGTPVGGKVSLTLGRAFDVTIARNQTAFRKISDKESESAFEIMLKNAGSQAVKVEVNEAFDGDWTIVKESAPHTKRDAQSAYWLIDVPAKGEARLNLTARSKM